VFAPGSALLSTGSTGVAFSHGGLAFTLTAGGTAFVAGDAFTIAVTDLGVSVWSVKRPDGVYLPNYTSGSTYNNQIKFVLTETSTHAVLGDNFTVAALIGGGNYIPSVATATDGSQKPVAILADLCDPSAGAVNAPLYFAGEFNGDALTFDTSFSVATLTAALRSQNIYIKTYVSAADPSNN
jgi:hypothetical protein